MEYQVNTQSSIRIEDEKVIYFDPFKLRDEKHDADAIFITHSHYDHMSEEDIFKVLKEDTKIVLPAACEEDVKEKGLPLEKCIFVKAGDIGTVCGINFKAVPAYNVGKKYHPMRNGWLGYVATVDKKDIYVCGDTDDNPYIREIICHMCFVPVGGTYTMDYEDAAEFINEIKPVIAVPTHYGSIVGTKEDGKKFKELVDENIKVEFALEDANE